MKSVLRHVLASNIRERRHALGLSQVKLAEAANIAPSYVAMIELEKNFPSDEVLERIAQALKMEPTELFSKACYHIEGIKELHKSVLAGFEQVVKSHIEEVEAKANMENFCL